MMSPIFLRFLTPPSPCHPFYKIQELWSKLTFWQIPPKWMTTFMDGPKLQFREATKKGLRDMWLQSVLRSPAVIKGHGKMKKIK